MHVMGYKDQERNGVCMSLMRVLCALQMPVTLHVSEMAAKIASSPHMPWICRTFMFFETALPLDRV